MPLVNVFPDVDNPLQFQILLNSLTLNSSDSQLEIASSNYPTLLDSGATLSHMPFLLVTKLGKMLNGKYSGQFDGYVVPCTTDTSYTFEFNFSGQTITVPLTNFLVNVDEDGEQCLLGFLSQGGTTTQGETFSLGDNFLRSVYVVYNLEDYEVSLAPVKYTNQKNIKAISSTVPGAQKAKFYSSTSFTNLYTEASALTTITYSTDKNTNGLTNAFGGSVTSIASEILFTLGESDSSIPMEKTTLGKTTTRDGSGSSLIRGSGSFFSKKADAGHLSVAFYSAIWIVVGNLLICL